MHLREQTYPIGHEGTCVTYNFNKIFDFFSFETNFVSCFPNCPADDGNAHSMELFAKRQPTLTPQPTLIKRFSYIVSTNTMSNNSPNCLSCTTLEKEMRSIFNLITEITRWVTKPLPSNQVIFHQNRIIEQKLEEDFDLAGILLFQILLWEGPESLDVIAL